MYLKNLSNSVHLRIDDDLYNYLWNISSDRCISVSELIRYILAEYKINNGGSDNGYNKTD